MTNATANAMASGFTVPAHVCIGMYDLDLLIRPDTDLDTRFKAWDCDLEEWVAVDGYNADDIEVAQ